MKKILIIAIALCAFGVQAEIQELTRQHTYRLGLTELVEIVNANFAVLETNVAIEAEDNEDGTGTVTITVTDSDGDGIDALIEFWVSDAEGGAVVSQTAAATVGGDGDQIQEIVGEDHLTAITDGGVLEITLTGNDTGFVVASVFGRLYSVAYVVTTD